MSKCKMSDVRCQMFLHGSNFATLAHLSVRRHDTLIGVLCSALHGPELISPCNTPSLVRPRHQVPLRRRLGNVIGRCQARRSPSSFTVADIVSVTASLLAIWSELWPSNVARAFEFNATAVAAAALVASNTTTTSTLFLPALKQAHFIPSGMRLAQEYPDKCFSHDANMFAQ